MLNLLLNNETAKNLGSLPFLTENTIWKGNSIMANQSIPKPKRICQVEGCNNAHHGRGFCARHYQKWYHGNLERTRNDPNEFIIRGDICLIRLYDRNSKFKATAIVDAEDYEKVKDYKWSLGDQGGVKCGHIGKFLHHVVLGFEWSECNEQVDHKNRNRLDNRKCRLRICSPSQNGSNQKQQSNNTSGYKGVYWDICKKRWHARIQANRKRIFLGLFDSKKEAAHAYNEAALKHHGEFARLNLIF